MAIDQMQLGPGLLTVGETGSLRNFSSQCSAVELVPDVNTEDNIPVLSGEEAQGDRTESYSLQGTLLQDFGRSDTVESLDEFCYTNAGTALPFEFVPNSSRGKAFTGTVVIEAHRIGGDVKKKNTSDFEWTCLGKPELVEVEGG